LLRFCLWHASEGWHPETLYIGQCDLIAVNGF
jgi:hypothetical protein